MWPSFAFYLHIKQHLPTSLYISFREITKVALFFTFKIDLMVFFAGCSGLSTELFYFPFYQHENPSCLISWWASGCLSLQPDLFGLFYSWSTNLLLTFAKLLGQMWVWAPEHGCHSLPFYVITAKFYLFFFFNLLLRSR